MTASRSSARGGRPFGLPGRAALTRLGGEAAAGLVAAADIALVVDSSGVIVDAAAGGGGASGIGAAAPADGSPAALVDAWVGRRLADTVTADSRTKVEMLLREAAAGPATAPRRQLNHATPDGVDLPVAYSGVRLADGAIVLVGRDLRAVSTLQQRLVETQQALERDYWRLRHVETRYRLLFQRSREAVLVVDAQTRKVADANAAAGALFGLPPERLVGRAFPPDAIAASRQALDDLLVATRFDGAGDEVDVRLADGRALRAAASCFRQDAQTLFLVRFAHLEAGGAATGVRISGAADAGPLAALLADAPDAFVVSDPAGHVVSANRAFLDLAQLGDAAQAVGRSLTEWVGRPGADLPVLLSMLKQHGVVRLVNTAVRGEHGTTTEVELSAVSAPDVVPPSLAWTIRDVGRRVGMGTGGARDLTRAVEQLTGLVGRVSLPDLVRDTVEMVERHFVEAALELTGDNRTAAAEVLGLSRQSLYLKLRRHRLLPTEGEAEAGV
jgi:transcriptional regulator PpsR